MAKPRVDCPAARKMSREAKELHIIVNGDELNDFESFSAGRSGDLYFVADLSVQESFADGRSCGDEAFFGVHFFAADEFVFDLDVFIGVEHENAGTVTG